MGAGQVFNLPRTDDFTGWPRTLYWRL